MKFNLNIEILFKYYIPVPTIQYNTIQYNTIGGLVNQK